MIPRKLKGIVKILIELLKIFLQSTPRLSLKKLRDLAEPLITVELV